MSTPNREFICIHDDNHLNNEEYILKKTISRTVGELLRLTFREDDKHLSMAGEDPRESRVTNWNFAGLWRAYKAVGEETSDELATVYPGVFDFTEYFSRSVDASKGDFYEMRIAASDPNQVLDVDRNLENLPQYLHASHLAWKTHEYTPGELERDEQNRYDELNDIGIDFDVAPSDADVDTGANTRQADSILLLDHPHPETGEDSKLLVFGEQRSSVNTGGTTARGSLYDKPRALLKGLASEVPVVQLDSKLSETDLGTNADELTLFEYLHLNDVDRVHFFIGMLFSTLRKPATRRDDQNDGRWSESVKQTKQIKRYCNRHKNIELVNFDASKLNLEINITDPTGKSDHTLEFRLAHEYGNKYVNALYNGYPAREFDDSEYLPSVGRTDLPEVMGETTADDLWLNFSITERENKAFYYGGGEGEDGKNNAMRMVDQILDTPELRAQLRVFRTTVQEGTREDVETVFAETQTKFAEAYLSEHADFIRAIYGEDPAIYARDLAAHVLSYDIIVSPLYLKLLPSYHEYEDEDEMPRFARLRKSFEEYLYQPKAEYSGTDRIAIFREIRRQTRYVRGGRKPADEEDEIDWTKAPTAGEIAAELGVNRVSPYYMDQDRHGLVHSNDSSGGNRYAIPADIAHRLDEFILPDEWVNSEKQLKQT